MYSFGVVLENTSTSVAAFMTVRVQPLDSDDNPLATDSGSALDREISVIRPGERVGIGASFELAERIANIDVQVADVQWWDPVNAKWSFAAITATDVETLRGAAPVSLSFTVTSEYADPVPSGRAFAVFRDDEGSIIGGAGPSADLQPPPGTSEGTLVLEHDPPGRTDDDRTEVYLSQLY